MGKLQKPIRELKGSTTLDEYLLRVAKDAAMLARFDTKTDAPIFQRGTITYILPELRIHVYLRCNPEYKLHWEYIESGLHL